jgi:hypothetical protein
MYKYNKYKGWVKEGSKREREWYRPFALRQVAEAHLVLV